MKESAAASASTIEFKIINPATEDIVNQYEIMTKDQINHKVKKARNAFQEWKKDANKRIDLLHNFASELRKVREPC